MVMRREGKPEAVSHQQIMAELVELKRAGEQGRAAINERLDAGAVRFEQIERSNGERFGEIEKVTKPFAKLIEDAGGQESFAKLCTEVVDAMKSIAWFGRLLRRLLVAVTVVGGAATALAAMVKVFLWDFGKGG